MASPPPPTFTHAHSLRNLQQASISGTFPPRYTRNPPHLHRDANRDILLCYVVVVFVVESPRGSKEQRSSIPVDFHVHKYDARIGRVVGSRNCVCACMERETRNAQARDDRQVASVPLGEDCIRLHFVVLVPFLISLTNVLQISFPEHVAIHGIYTKEFLAKEDIAFPSHSTLRGDAQHIRCQSYLILVLWLER